MLDRTLTTPNSLFFTKGRMPQMEIPCKPHAKCLKKDKHLDKCNNPECQNFIHPSCFSKLLVAFAEGDKLDVHIVIDTPGKVVDWMKKKIINPKKVKVFVLYEADNMVHKDGHQANSLIINKQLPSSCQCLLFSATYPEDVIKFAEKMVTNPHKILIESRPDDLDSADLDQQYSCNFVYKIIFLITVFLCLFRSWM